MKDNGQLDAAIRRERERDYRAGILEEESRKVIRQVAAFDVFVFQTPPVGGYPTKLALELGSAIMLGKKIIVVSYKDRKPPAVLKKIADAAFRMENPPTTKEGKAEFERKFAEALAKVEDGV